MASPAVKRGTPADESQSVAQPRPLLQSRTFAVVTHLAVFGGFMLAASVLTWPLVPQIGGFVFDKADPLYSVWAMAWQAHAVATNPAGLFDSNIMFPFRGTLAFDELSFAEAVLAAPIYFVSGNPVLSHNVLLLLTFGLSGYAAWLLVRFITGSSWAGVVAGAVFAFSFYRFNHLSHMTLLNTQWMPLVLLATYKLLRKPTWLWIGALWIFLTLQVLSSHYLAFFTALLVGFFVIFYLLVARPERPLRFVGAICLTLAGALVVSLPILVPYVQVQGEHAFTRTLFEVERFSNTLASFLSVFRGNPIYRALLAPFADPGPWPFERAAFPGVATLALAVAGIVLAFRARDRAAGSPAPRSEASPWHHGLFFALVALLSAVLSLGPTLQATYADSAYDATAIRGIAPLPYRLLYDWVPGFQSMRVVGRFDALTALSLSVLAGIGAFYVLKWATARPPGGVQARALAPSLALVLALLPGIETWSAPVEMQAVATRGAVPQVYRWLSTQPATVVLEYPMTSYKPGPQSVWLANTYQYYSVYHWQRLVNGSTTIRPASYSAVVLETQDCFPCPRSLDAIWALGVRLVVVHLDSLSDAQRTEFLWRSTDPAGKVVGDFTLVEDYGNERVYRLEPRALGGLGAEIPANGSVLLGDPARDPIRAGTDASFIGGGYLAAVGRMLGASRALYGDPRLAFDYPVRPPDARNPPDYAVLWARDDPARYGYLVQNRMWANEFVSVYKRGPGRAATGTAR